MNQARWRRGAENVPASYYLAKGYAGCGERWGHKQVGRVVGSAPLGAFQGWLIAFLPSFVDRQIQANSISQLEKRQTRLVGGGRGATPPPPPRLGGNEGDAFIRCLRGRTRRHMMRVNHCK